MAWCNVWKEGRFRIAQVKSLRWYEHDRANIRVMAVTRTYSSFDYPSLMGERFSWVRVTAITRIFSRSCSYKRNDFTWAIRNLPSFRTLHQAIRFLQSQRPRF